jgi:hypothetical protein
MHILERNLPPRRRRSLKSLKLFPKKAFIGHCGHFMLLVTNSCTKSAKLRLFRSFGEARLLLVKKLPHISSSQALESDEIIWKVIEPLKFLDHDGNDPSVNVWAEVREDHLLFSPDTFTIIFNQYVR